MLGHVGQGARNFYLTVKAATPSAQLPTLAAKSQDRMPDQRIETLGNSRCPRLRVAELGSVTQAIPLATET
jgi:predicted component of type VI protein secretion system